MKARNRLAKFSNGDVHAYDGEVFAFTGQQAQPDTDAFFLGAVMFSLVDEVVAALGRAN